MRTLEEDQRHHEWWTHGVLSCIRERANLDSKVENGVISETVEDCDKFTNKNATRKSVSDKIRDETMKQGTRMEASNLLDEPLLSAMTHQPSSCRVTNFTGDVDAEKENVEKMFIENGWTVKKNKKKSSKKMQSCGLNTLTTIEPGGMNAINTTGVWEEIEFAVDSGATETVVNDDMLMSIETKPSASSRRGVEYEVANGCTIPNLGEKRFRGFSIEGQGKDITAQVCDVNKALLSVRKVAAAGNKVIFEKQGAYIEDPGGRRIWLEEKQGMYMLKLWVNKDSPF